MTLLQLKYVDALDTYRSFSKAAAACGISQPTLSTQIQKVEEELGVQLFDRSRKPVSPTPLGKIVVAQARTVLSESAKIPRQIQSRIGKATEKLRVGVIPTISTYMLPQLVPRLIRYFPQVSFEFTEGLMAEILVQLRNSALDVGIMSTPKPSRGLVSETLYTEALVAYVSEGHRLANQRTVNQQELTLSDIWLPPDGNPLRETIFQVCKAPKIDVPRAVSFESNSLEIIKRLVEQNQGMAILPVSAVQGTVFHRSDLVKHFEEPVPVREVCAVHPKTLLKKELVETLITDILYTVSSPQLTSRQVTKRPRN